MKTTCNAILLKRISYGDTSVILSCLTEKNGLQAFLFKGGKKKNASVLLPLKSIEITYYQREENQLATAYEVQSSLSLLRIYTNPIKNSILFFISEFLSMMMPSIQHSEPHYYDELLHELKWLEMSDELANYPIYWMITWIQRLGVQPTLSYGHYWDVERARFVDHQPLSTLYFVGDEMDALSHLMNEGRNQILSHAFTKKERTSILSALFAYFRFHIPECKELSSIEILQTVLN